MTYNVCWREDAADELAAIWLKGNSSNRRDVTAAADAIDKALAANPIERGESRGEERRIFYSHPLAVIFHVLEQDRIVYVLQVWSVW